MKALLIAGEEMARAVAKGDKQITIRTGRRSFEPGKAIIICCHLLNWAVMADVVDVKHKELQKVTYEEYSDDGFESWDDMYDGLRRFYPDLKPYDTVTVLRWTNVRGGMVDHLRKL